LYSEALQKYLPAFLDREERFLRAYDPALRNGLEVRSWTRGEFWDMARRAAAVLRRCGLGKGDTFVNAYGKNTPEDMMFRLGATMVGAVPVTVNWQADGVEQMAYKIGLTECRLMLHDASFLDLAAPEMTADMGDFRTQLLARFPKLAEYDVANLSGEAPMSEDEFLPDLTGDDDRIVIFTSGTTGHPKGARLTYGSYENNDAALGTYLLLDRVGALPGGRGSLFLLINPLHHANSTAVSDMLVRRPHSEILLFPRYGTFYWKAVAECVDEGDRRRIAPTVARHFDYLEHLRETNALPVDEGRLREAMRKVEFVLGSAPVGPTTVDRLRRWTGRIPSVRFGSTETCFHVLGTPLDMSDERRMAAFERGWNHAPETGYWIGRPHPPLTEVRIVEQVDPTKEGYMRECAEGQSGYMVCRGGNVMKAYVKNDEGTDRVLRDGWYLGLLDIAFRLTNPDDGGTDFYWVGRDSALVIRGGANYACDQINVELCRFVEKRYGLPCDDFDLAVAGLRLVSEHEDSCCVTVELKSERARECADEIRRTFLPEARHSVSKGAKPDFLRFGEVFRTFKGTIRLAEIKRAWMDDFRQKE
jgi:acyl-CoA synthetase (AMP-forming)/AMP-acid ligase II